MRRMIEGIDTQLIAYCRQWEVPFARFAIFIVYFWFGFLKLIGLSPATPLVYALFDRTLAWMLPFGLFSVLFAVFEITIGILFLLRGFERPALVFLALHLVTTALPLVVMPHFVWQAFLVPTLEGQYIIKNILLMAAGVLVASRLTPLAVRRAR